MYTTDESIFILSEVQLASGAIILRCWLLIGRLLISGTAAKRYQLGGVSHFNSVFGQAFFFFSLPPPPPPPRSF